MAASLESPPKTEFCKLFFCTGTCPADNGCHFAHSQQELQPLNPRKTKICELFEIRCCPAPAVACNCAHGPQDLAASRHEISKHRARKRGVLNKLGPVGPVGGPNEPGCHGVVGVPSAGRGMPSPTASTAARPNRVNYEDKKKIVDFLYRNDGISVSEFVVSFLRATGEKVPYAQLGYSSLTAFLESMPDVCRLELDPDCTKVFLQRNRFESHRKRLDKLAKITSHVTPQLEQPVVDPANRVDQGAGSATSVVLPQRPVWVQQLLGWISQLIICPLCSHILSLEFLMLPCGHLYCTFCILAAVDGPSGRMLGTQHVNCQACDKRHKFLHSPEECFFDISRDDAPEQARLFELVASVPIRCFLYECPWRGTIGRWPLHENVCPLLTRYSKSGRDRYLELSKSESHHSGHTDDAAGQVLENDGTTTAAGQISGAILNDDQQLITVVDEIIVDSMFKDRGQPEKQLSKDIHLATKECRRLFKLRIREFRQLVGHNSRNFISASRSGKLDVDRC